MDRMIKLTNTWGDGTKGLPGAVDYRDEFTHVAASLRRLDGTVEDRSYFTDRLGRRVTLEEVFGPSCLAGLAAPAVQLELNL